MILISESWWLKVISDLKLLWLRWALSRYDSGLDIGGANTKAASSDGLWTESVYLPLWRNAPLAEVLQRFSRLDPEAVAVVITGELADCFSCKSEGIEASAPRQGKHLAVPSTSGA